MPAASIPSRHAPLLTGERLEAFGAELDALREKHVRDLGAADARYIRRVRHAVRWTEVLGRLAIYGSAPAPWLLWPLWIIGTLLLAVSKILDNMELGHNVIHGQRAGWYQRQIRGSSNIGGGALMDLMTGNLSHQIEHHLYPDLPARRYAAMAVEVKAICAKYGVPYNTGSLPKQFGEVVWRIVRHAFPSRPTWVAAAAG